MTARKSVPPPVTLRGIMDVELGVTLRTESDAAAVRIARKLGEGGLTQAERIAVYEFLHKVAAAVRWPDWPLS